MRKGVDCSTRCGRHNAPYSIAKASTRHDGDPGRGGTGEGAAGGGEGSAPGRVLQGRRHRRGSRSESGGGRRDNGHGARIRQAPDAPKRRAQRPLAPGQVLYFCSLFQAVGSEGKAILPTTGEPVQLAMFAWKTYQDGQEGAHPASLIPVARDDRAGASRTRHRRRPVG